MNIAVIGTGYVGLVTGTCFAENGNTVICVDNNEEKVQSLLQGQIPIYEPGLEELVTKNVASHRLRFTTNLGEAVTQAQIIFFCLPTPPKEDGSADLKYVLQVCKDMAPFITEFKVIVNKSTVPVGTTAKIAEIIQSLCTVEVAVVSNPEFLREGRAVSDFLHPERVVVGTTVPVVENIMLDLYAPFVENKDQILIMDERSSEMTKYAANTFLATKISFINEIANLCDLVGANVEWVSKGIGTDSRIGLQFLHAGIGYGGSCFPKDVSALNKTAQELGYDFKIGQSVMEVNKTQRLLIVQRLQEELGTLSGKKIAVWGLAFKPDTDDLREAPSLDILPELVKQGAMVSVFDPAAMGEMQKHYSWPLEYQDTMYDCLEQAEALVILTDWNDFKQPDFEKVLGLMKQPIIIDGRNIYNLDKMRGLGIRYRSVGRPGVGSGKIKVES